MIEKVYAQLLAYVMPPFSLVGTAADYAPIDLERNPPLAYPALYLVPLREDAHPSPRVGSTRDQVTLYFGTVTIVSNVAGDLGGDAVFDIKAPREAIRDAINGWLPDMAKHPVRYAGGELVDFVAGRLAWQDVWSFTFTTPT